MFPSAAIIALLAIILFLASSTSILPGSASSSEWLGTIKKIG